MRLKHKLTKLLGLNSYKLARFIESWLKESRLQSEHEDKGEIEDAINLVSLSEKDDLEGVKNSEGIRASTTRKWLDKLGFSWKDMKKGCSSTDMNVKM